MQFAIYIVKCMAVARSSSDDNAMCHVLPVLWMTSCLPVIGQANETDAPSGPLVGCGGDIFPHTPPQNDSRILQKFPKVKVRRMLKFYDAVTTTIRLNDEVMRCWFNIAAGPTTHTVQCRQSTATIALLSQSRTQSTL